MEVGCHFAEVSCVCVYACVRVMRSKTDLRVSGRQAALRKRPLDFYQANVAMES